MPRYSPVKGDFGALIERLERDGVDEGLRVEQVTALAWWYARTTDGGVEDVVGGVLAWWDRTCGGSSKDAAQDWRRTRVEVERLACWKAKRTLAEKAPKLTPRFSTPPVLSAVVAKIRALLTDDEASEFLEPLCRVWAHLHVRVKNGRRIIPMHAALVWCRLMGSGARDYVAGEVGYKRLQAVAARIFGMVKIGGWKVKFYSQHWVVSTLLRVPASPSVEPLTDYDGCSLTRQGDRLWVTAAGVPLVRASLAEVAWAIRAGPAAMIGA